MAYLPAQASDRTPEDRPGPVHRRAAPAEHWGQRSFHPNSRSPVLPRSLWPQARRLSGGAVGVRKDAVPAAEPRSLRRRHRRCDRGGYGSGPDAPALGLRRQSSSWPAEQPPQCAAEDFHVSAKGCGPNVLQLEGQLGRHHRCQVLHLGVALAEDLLLLEVGDRGHSGDAGADRQDFALLPRVVQDILRSLGPRTDQAHVPAHHVQELRKLVELGLTEEATDCRHTWIVGAGYAGPALGGGNAHCAELVDAERSSVTPDAFPAVNDGPLRLELDQYAGDRDHG